MGRTALADPVYVMGRTDAEARRLVLQAQLYDRITRRFLADAGLAPGMTVLDVGSGMGDVAFAAADIVGPNGRVIGVDLNPAVVAEARNRAREAGRDTVRFVAGDCRNASLSDEFDAAIGRFVLMYTHNVTEALQAVVDRVKPGGIVAFAEADFTSALGYVHAGPNDTARSVWDWAAAAFQRSGIHISMAMPLNRAFIATGLGEPEMVVHTPLGGGDTWPGYEWGAASLRSLLPVLEQHEIVTDNVLDVDTLAVRCRAEVIESGYPFTLLPMVTAWSRKPISA